MLPSLQWVCNAFKQCLGLLYSIFDLNTHTLVLLDTTVLCITNQDYYPIFLTSEASSVWGRSYFFRNELPKARNSLFLLEVVWPAVLKYLLTSLPFVRKWSSHPRGEQGVPPHTQVLGKERGWRQRLWGPFSSTEVGMQESWSSDLGHSSLPLATLQAALPRRVVVQLGWVEALPP